MENTQRICLKQLTDFHQYIGGLRYLCVMEITDKNQVVAAFFQRTLGYIVIAEFVCFSPFSESFGNICSN